MYEEYGEEVEFLVIYIREAHAIDSTWPMGGNGHPLVEEPITAEERAAVATQCMTKLDMSPMRMLMDDMEDSTGWDYAAWPDRLFLVDLKGKIAYSGARGPMGFRPDQLEQAIRAELGLPGEKDEGESKPRKGPQDI